MVSDETSTLAILGEIRDLLARIEARTRAQYEGSPSDEAVSAVVRGELARAGVDKAQVASILGVSKPTAYAKANGHYPFSLQELAAIAVFLNTTVLELLHSAVTHEYRNPELPTVDPRVGLHEDIWASPAQSRSAARAYSRESQSAESPRKRRSRT